MKQLHTAVAGSFKFKPEIDRLHQEFADFNVTVLEPTQGWLFLPAIHHSANRESFRPLPQERHMPGIKSIENRFLAAIKKSDFLYLFNPGQYIGVSAAFEVGYGLAEGKPVFAAEPISLENVDYDIERHAYLTNAVTVATSSLAAAACRQEQR